MIQPWRVVSSTITYQDRWLKLRGDDCLTPEGARVAPYHVLEYPDWINVVALTRELKLILVREYRHGWGDVVTGLVSGAVEISDTGASAAEAAAKRELLEETGYGGGDFIAILTAYANPANQNNRVISFLALNVEARGPQSLDEGEAVEMFMDDLPSVLRRLRSGDLTMRAMHVAALWAAAASPLRDPLLSIFKG